MTNPRVTPEESALLQLGAAGHWVWPVAAAVLDGPAISVEELATRTSDALARLPRYRAEPVGVPLGMERPVWASTATFDVRDHVRRLDADLPDGEGGLEQWLVEYAVQPLEGRMFELAICEGLPGGRWLLLAKIHLCLVDGVHGIDLFTRLVAPDVVVPPAEPALSPTPSPQRLLLDAARDLALNPYEQVRAARAFTRRFRPPDPRRRPAPRPAPPKAARVILPLDELKAIRTSLGGSVHSVLVSLAVAGVHASGDEAPVVRTAIPFAVRSLSRPGHYDNQVAVDHVNLPTQPDDPVARYRTVSEQLERFARDNLAVGGRTLTRLSGVPPFLLLALGARACIRESADLCVVNAPGPGVPLRAFDRDMVDVYTVLPHPPAVRWSATARNYGRDVSVLLTGDGADAVEAAAAGVGNEHRALLSAAERQDQPAPGTRRRATKG